MLSSSGLARKASFVPHIWRFHTRIILPSLSSPITACRTYDTLLNGQGTKEEGSKIKSEFKLDVITDKKTDKASSKIIIEYNSPADITVLGMPLRSIILLNVVAIIWGTQHSVIKSVVDDSVIIGLGNDFGFTNWVLTTLQDSKTIAHDAAGCDDDAAAAYFTLARFSLAALLASPYTPVLKLQQRNDDIGDDATNLAWKYGVELGMYMFLGYAFQAIGLQTTTASRSGFLLYLNVKLVPFFSFFLFGKSIQLSTWISALVAFGGTALLAVDNASAGTFSLDASSFCVGDLWSIAAAAASALFILRMETASKAVPKSAELNAANLWTVAFFSLSWAVCVSFNNLYSDDATLYTQTLPDVLTQTINQTFQRTLYTIVTNPLQLIYLSAVTTALANYIQSIAQKDISAERASIFYALDPVYGAAFANLLLGETLGLWGWVGATLIALAAATNAVWDFSTTDIGSGSKLSKEKSN